MPRRVTRQKNYRVVRVEKAYFKKNEYLTSVSIPNSVSTIDDGAFRGCSNLMTIVLPNQPCFLSAAAFEGCKVVTNIYTQSRNTNNLAYVLEALDPNCPVVKNPQSAAFPVSQPSPSNPSVADRRPERTGSESGRCY